MWDICLVAAQEYTPKRGPKKKRHQSASDAYTPLQRKLTPGELIVEELLAPQTPATAIRDMKSQVVVEYECSADVNIQPQRVRFMDLEDLVRMRDICVQTDSIHLSDDQVEEDCIDYYSYFDLPPINIPEDVSSTPAEMTIFGYQIENSMSASSFSASPIKKHRHSF